MFQLHAQVQGQIYGALRLICNYYDANEPEATRDNEKLQHSAMWQLFKFELLGIGCAADPPKALQTLLNDARPELGANWKSYVTIKLLHIALDVEIPPERKPLIDFLAGAAASVGSFLTSAALETGN